jgi:pyridoxamine 5'-phosphate oxidase
VRAYTATRCIRTISELYDLPVNDDLAHLRIDYDGDPLDLAVIGSDPMRCFSTWFDDATLRPQVAEANAMSLATCTPDGTPSVRMVLLKQLDERRAAFGFYTNLDSRKAHEARSLDRAALCWWWPGTPGRQVRVVGRVEPIDRQAAAEYFDSRPVDARIGAIASVQSRAIVDRQELDQACARSEDPAPKIPDFWGGMWVVADEIELWQGRHGRLHDRIVFLRLDEDRQVCSRAAVAAAGGDDQLARCATAVVDPHGTSWLRARLAP